MAQHDAQYLTKTANEKVSNRKEFLLNQVNEDTDKDNLAKFIDYRVSKKVEEVILDHKDEIRRSLAEQREDNYM